jgi:soluble lytic murein transglycosylase
MPTFEAMKLHLAATLGALVFVAAATALAAAPRTAKAQRSAPAAAAAPVEDVAVQAREALRLKDKAKLAELRQLALAQNHPLAPWVDYFELGNRLETAQQSELDQFAERWRGSYVEDRLRNDWLLELGKRRDWANIRAEYPRFRMNDDKEVTCFAMVAQLLEGKDVGAAARSAWLAQRDGEDGCLMLGQTLWDAKLISADDVWQQVRAQVEANRQRAARGSTALLGPRESTALEAVLRDPAKFLRERQNRDAVAGQRAIVLALWRLAANEPEAAAAQLETHFASSLAPAELAHAWAGIGRQAALKHSPLAHDHVAKAWAAWDRSPAAKAGGGANAAATRVVTPAAAGTPASLAAAPATAPVTAPATATSTSAAPTPSPGFTDDTLAWQVRAALRATTPDKSRWTVVRRAIDAMSATELRDNAWTYWRARAEAALAAPGAEGEAARAAARRSLEGMASPYSFYGQLASEDLGRKLSLPPGPPALTEAELQALRKQPGFNRALQLIELGLRSEGVREWNFSLRGLNDRELLSAAQWACEREVWDRCINTSERSKAEADPLQRYPTPLREQVLAKAKTVGVDPAYVYGLIRQESRFIMDTRSHVGATGLMQLMPATARWTAKRVGLDWKPELINDRDVNLLLGTTYLKLVLDDFNGTQAMGAAAYNAGPNRPRRWREGAAVEAAAWIEGIPFHETRDYVKKVLSNAVVYAMRFGETGANVPGTSGTQGGTGASAAPGTSLKARLGGPIGPREAAAPAENKELP